ncbi:6060_t:CDS:2, partial [Paraglomus brasilianum]
MKGLDPEEYMDPSKSWRDNEKLVYGKLIRDRPINKYDVSELERIVQDCRYHSPERFPERSSSSSSSDEIIVYNLSWRSEELKSLLRDDKHGFEVRKSSHKRRRIMSEVEERADIPEGAPAWYTL